MDLQALLEEKRKAKEEFKQMLELPAWNELVRLLKAGAEMRRVEAVQPARSMDDAFKSSAAGAELAGLELAMRMPYVYVEELDRDIKTLLQQIEESDNG